MSILNQVELTLEETKKIERNKIAANATRDINYFKDSYKETFNLIWNNNKLKAQQVFDAFDNEAYLLFVKAQATIDYIISQDSSYSPPLPTILFDINFTTGVVTLAPQVYTQPQSAVIDSGSNYTLIVEAYSTQNPTYQWKKDGVDINGATSSTYQITNMAVENNGSYQVAVTNSVGTTLSQLAVVEMK